MAKAETPPNDASSGGSASLGSCRKLGRVSGREPLGSMVLLTVKTPGWTAARPGQFVMLQAEDSDCFLGRALSVCGQSGESVSFLVAPIGKGTRELCSLAEGDRVWVLGPLGNGFDLDALTTTGERVVLVGGGVGIAPFPLLVSELTGCLGARQGANGEKGLGVLALAGFRDSEQALGCAPLAESVARAEKDGLSCAYESVLETSSGGPAERATDLLARHVESGDRVAVCGPEAMAEAVWEVCSRLSDVKVWFSLETNMACGVGSCHGCVVALADGSYARVCREGPVFAGEEVFGD